MKRILIVEDNLYLRDMYAEVLTTNGFSVEFADDGEQAIDKVRQQQFDLVLLDILLPKKNGMDVLKEIRIENTPITNLPVIMITNLGDESIIDEAFKLGADGYILKAKVKPDDLIKQIQEFFSKLDAQ